MLLPLGPDQEAHLLKICEEMGRSPEDFVREAVLRFMEDYEDGRDAEEALKEAEATRFYTSEELRRELGLDDNVHAQGSQAA